MIKPNMRCLMAVLSLLAVAALALGACAPQPQAPAETVALKIAVLPIIDALPLYVAEKQGYFAENNLAVTFIPAGSAAERDQIIAAGQADGMINDLVSVALYNKDSVMVQTVRYARVADSKTAMYRVLAAKDSGITTPAGLAGVPVGMSQNTVIDYVTSRLLEKAGLKPEQIESVAVPKLPDRLALLGQGQIKAATLPEPFGTVAEGSGAVRIVDDSQYPEYGYSVISFRKSVIDLHPDAIKGFLQAVEKAAQDIDQTPENFRALLGEYKMVPEVVQSSYPMPPFKANGVPSEAQWKDVVEWMKTRTLIAKDLPYGDSITAQFLPK